MIICMNTSVVRIHCFTCNKEYLLNSEDISTNDIHNCPHCNAKIDKQMWDMIIHAMNTINDVNGHFKKYHNERQENLFSISIENKPTIYRE